MISKRRLNAIATLILLLAGEVPAKAQVYLTQYFGQTTEEITISSASRYPAGTYLAIDSDDGNNWIVTDESNGIARVPKSAMKLVPIFKYNVPLKGVVQESMVPLVAAPQERTIEQYTSLTQSPGGNVAAAAPSVGTELSIIGRMQNYYVISYPGDQTPVEKEVWKNDLASLEPDLWLLPVSAVALEGSPNMAGSILTPPAWNPNNVPGFVDDVTVYDANGNAVTNPFINLPYYVLFGFFCALYAGFYVAGESASTAKSRAEKWSRYKDKYQYNEMIGEWQRILSHSPGTGTVTVDAESRARRIIREQEYKKWVWKKALRADWGLPVALIVCVAASGDSLVETGFFSSRRL